MKYLCIFLFVLLCSCTSRLGDFSILSNKNVDFDGIAKTKSSGTYIEETIGRSWILFVPLASEPTVEDICDAVLMHGNGDFMKDAVIYTYSLDLLLFSYDSVTIKGVVYNSKHKE